MSIITGSRSNSIVESLAEMPDDLTELVREMRKDPVVQLAERVIRSNAKAATVTFTARQKTPQVQALAAMLEQLWLKNLALALDAYPYGWQPFEIGWGTARGMQYPKELVPLPHSAVPTDDMVIEAGKVRSITVKGEGDAKLELSRPYLWIATVDRTALRPLGTAQFKGAVEDAWREHKELRARRKEFARKHVLGTSIIRAPKWEERADHNSNTIVSVDVHKEIGDAMQMARAGDHIILSSDRLLKSDGSDGDYKISIERDGGECNDASPLIALIDSVGDELLLANGIPPKTLVEGDGVGSFALVTQQMQILMNRIEDIFAAIHESFVEFVVREASILNTGAPNAIESTFTPIAERPDDLGREIVKSIMTSPQLSPMVMSGAVDVAALLRAQGVPVSQSFAADIGKLRIQQPSVAAMSLPETWRGLW